MKARSITALGLFAVVALGAIAAIWCIGQRAEGAWPFGRSEPPQRPLPRRYLKVALTGDASKVVSVVFDASQGTATQYDTVYADLASSVSLERAKKLEAKPRKQGANITCAFPAYDLPRDEKETGTSTSAALILCHCRQSGETFCVTGRTAVTEGATRWQYLSRSQAKPSESADKAPLLQLNQKPELAIETKPDLQKKGNLGIALNLKSGAVSMECTKNGKPLDAHIAVKSADGKTVREDSQPIDKFAFG